MEHKLRNVIEEGRKNIVKFGTYNKLHCKNKIVMLLKEIQLASRTLVGWVVWPRISNNLA